MRNENKNINDESVVAGVVARTPSTIRLPEGEASAAALTCEETIDAPVMMQAALEGAQIDQPAKTAAAAKAAADRVASMLQKAAERRARLLKGRSDENTEAVAGAATQPAPPPQQPPPLTPAKLAEAQAALQQADVEGLTLQRSERAITGFKCVFFDRSSSLKPYLAKPQRDGKSVQLGHYATAEQAALALARWGKGEQIQEQMAAAAVPVPVVVEAKALAPPPQPPPPLTAAQQAAAQAALAEAEAEGVTLVRSDRSCTGFKWVVFDNVHNKRKPYIARVTIDGKQTILGHFAAAEQAALCIARWQKEQQEQWIPSLLKTIPVAPMPPPPPTPTQQAAADAALQQAEAEGLTLVRSERCSTGFQNVYYIPHFSALHPYLAREVRDGKQRTFGYFATPEQAALCIARWHKQQVGLAEMGVENVPSLGPAAAAAAVAAAAAAAAAAWLVEGDCSRYAISRAHAAATAADTSHPAAAQTALALAEAEGLTLMRSDRGITGFKNVYNDRNNANKPYLAKETRDGKVVRLGVYETPEQAALCIARWHKQQAATLSTEPAQPPMSKEPLQPPMSAEAAKQTAEAEGLTLQRGTNQTGFKWVVYDKYHGSATPYQTKVWQGERRGGSYVALGSFGTPEEAALCYARWAAGQQMAVHQEIDGEMVVDGEYVGEVDQDLGGEEDFVPECVEVVAYEAGDDDDEDAFYVEACAADDEVGEEVEAEEVSTEDTAEEGVYTVESLVASRMHGGRRQFLVRWHGYQREDDTWEDEANILDPDLIRLFDLFVAGPVSTVVSKAGEKRSLPAAPAVAAKLPRVV